MQILDKAVLFPLPFPFGILLWLEESCSVCCRDGGGSADKYLLILDKQTLPSTTHTHL